MSSAILSADDLNDFISPGVACIKPIETLPKDDSSNPYEVTTEDKVQAQNPAPASISLTDCLACSGCVTSAEAVLVSLQSHTEVLNTLDAHPSLDVRALLDDPAYAPPPDARVFVASVSPQVRATIAATFRISGTRAGRLIEHFLSGSQGLRIGGTHRSDFSYVLDTNCLREACLVLGSDEVADSLSSNTKPKPVITSACPGWICYAEKTHPHVLPHLSALKSPQALTGTLVKSVLSKKLNIHPSQIWHLALMPCFDKKLEASREELTDRWWRSDLPPDSVDANNIPIRDVDCVITSRELLTLASARGVSLASLPTTPIPRRERTPFPDPVLSKFLLTRASLQRRMQKPEASTSGGYLHHILLTRQSQHPGSTISTTRGRNNDVTEYTLSSTDNTPILKCARYYGFRNIQNLVRKLKPKAASKMPGAVSRRAGASARGEGCDYAYVEVMACPGGCTNGGGQIKAEDVAEILPQTRGEEVQTGLITNGDGKIRSTPQSQKEWLARVDEAYFSADTEESDVEEQNDNGPMHANGDVDMYDADQESQPTKVVVNDVDVTEIHELLRHWSDLVAVPLGTLCYTTYRKVESDVGKSKKEVSKMGDSARIAAIAGMSGGGW